MTASSFVENEPFAINNIGTTPILAPENWWGLPVGPVPFGAGLVAPPRGGDAQFVAGPILTHPHRMSP